MRKREEKSIIEIKEEVQIGDVLLEKGDRIKILQQESIISDAIGEGNLYLIDILMDIYTNQNILDYSKEIKIVKRITKQQNIENLFTSSIKKFSRNPSYLIGIKDYKQMANELIDVTGIIFYKNNDIKDLMDLYY